MNNLTQQTRQWEHKATQAQTKTNTTKQWKQKTKEMR